MQTVNGSGIRRRPLGWAAFIGFLASCSIVAASTDDELVNNDDDEVTGVYRVLNASLSVNDCEKSGRSVDYASKFIRFSAVDEGYRSEVCDGDDLDELDCNVSHSVIGMQEQTKTGWQGFRYSARLGVAADGTPTCLLASARRRINLEGHGVLHYERSDWSELVSDFQWECERGMAKVYADAQSLKCNTHIVLELQKEYLARPNDAPGQLDKALPASPRP